MSPSAAPSSSNVMFLTPPPQKHVQLPTLAMPDTPPASPVLKTLRPGNAFAQWGESPPSSPALSQDAWSSDVESDAGLDDDHVAGNGFKRALHGGNDSDIPDGLRTPKGHPLMGHKRLASKGGLGLGLGFGRFGLNLGSLKEEVLTEEEKYDIREKRKSIVSTERSPFFPATKSPWKMPHIRVSKRSRPALYAVGLVMFFLIFVATHSRSTATRPLSSLPHRRHIYPAESNDDIILDGGAAVSHNRALVGAHRKRAPTKTLSPSARTVDFKWAGKDMELAGLLSFMAASESNTVPQYDSTSALDPYLILDFDPVSSHAAKDLKEMRASLWRDHPVILLSRTRNAHSRFIKSTLADLYIHPAPLIMDIDQRSDADVLDSLFQRLMGQSELPILLVGGEVVGGWADVENLSQLSLLKPLITSHGGFFAPPKNKKKKKSGHGGKSEEQLRKELEAAKKADELKRRELALELEEERLREIAQAQKEEVPVEDLEDPENF